MRNSRSLTAVVGALAAALVLSACGGGGGDATSSASPEDSGSATDAPATDDASGSADADSTLTFAIGGDPASLNPINVSDRWGLTTTNIVYSPLARIQPDGTLRPELAKTIEPAADGLSVTVTLRDDVLWSDGEPFTADDVVFTYTEKAKVENGNADSLLVGGEPITATAVDEHTVRFDLPAVSAAAASNITTETYILPEHVYSGVTDFSVAELDPVAVGTGPYTLEEYRPGEVIRLKANENYFGGAPKIENINLRIVTSPDTIKAALQTGELDASNVLPADLADLEGAPVTPTAFSEGRVGYLGAISTRPALTNVDVRKAIFLGIDREELNLAAYLDPKYFTNATTILPPSNPFFNDEGVETYEQDQDAAKALLEGAGVSGLTVSLGYISTDAAQTLQATLIQQQLSQIGVTVNLVGLDSGALYAELDKGADASFDLFLGGYIMGNDPDFYGALFRTDASSNFFGYSNPTTDALFDAGAAELDPAARATIYHDLQKQIAKDAIFFPIVDNKRILVFNDRIGGVEDATPVPIYGLEFWNLLTAD